MDIGSKIKDLRVKNYLTQEELADRSELTKGFISQVERNLTSPSIATLIDILEALGVTPLEFFNEAEEKIVFKDEDYFVSKRDESYKVTWIVPNAQKNHMEPTILEIEGNSRTREVSPFDGEILGYVIDGSIELVYGEEIFHLKKNETFYFSANKVSCLINKNKKLAKLICISSPPNF